MKSLIIFLLFNFFLSFTSARMFTYRINIAKGIMPTKTNWNVTSPTNLVNITDNDFSTTASTGTCAEGYYGTIRITFSGERKNINVRFKYGISLSGVTNNTDSQYDDNIFFQIISPKSYFITTHEIINVTANYLEIKCWPYIGATTNMHVYEMQALSNIYIPRKM